MLFSRIQFRKVLVVTAVLFANLGTSCVKDKPGDTAKDVPKNLDARVFIANEGSLGNGNASLSVADLQTAEVYNDVFSSRNQQDLGDVFQSMLISQDQLFLAINNSDKIVVLDKTDYSLLHTIAVRKPRQMLLLSEDKMYVSTMYYPEIQIVNPKTGSHLGTITTDFPTIEGMTYLNGKVYACNWDTACNYLYEIDPQTDKIVGRIALPGSAPQQVVADKEDKLWVLAGNYTKGKAASITRVDPVQRTILKQFHYEDADLIKPVWNAGKDTLYFLGVNYNHNAAVNGVYRMSIYDTQLPDQMFIAAQPLQYFWALGYDTLRHQVYVGDPKGFIQRGRIHVYTTKGNELRNFDVGIGPGCFLFE